MLGEDRFAAMLAAASGHYDPLQFKFSAETELVLLRVLWAAALLLGLASAVQGLLFLRVQRGSWPRRLERLSEPAPRVAGLALAVGLLGVGMSVLVVLLLGVPGAWQAALLGAFALGMLCHREFHIALGASAMLLATVGLISLPVAFVSELAPPGGPGSLSTAEIARLLGMTDLVVAVLWSVCARRWIRLQTPLGPLCTSARLVWPAVLLAMVCMLAGSLWLLLGYGLMRLPG